MKYFTISALHAAIFANKFFKRAANLRALLFDILVHFIIFHPDFVILELFRRPLEQFRFHNRSRFADRYRDGRDQRKTQSDQIQ